jgi:hypothetical protein
MELNAQLAELVSWLQSEIHAWAAGLSDDERAAAGQPDGWAARDLLIHFAEWAEVLDEKLAAVVAGRELPQLPPDDEINRQFFDRNRALSWAEAMGKFDRAHAALESRLRATPADALANTSQLEGRPVSWIILFEAVDHVLRHLAENLVERVQSDAAYALMEKGAAQMTAVEETPRFHCLVTYNLGCFYALNGSQAQALDKLREALVDQPDIAKWATQDPDLDSLRDDPAFLTLVSDR